jgi:hypothetical protein
LRDARHCGLHAMRSFVRKLRQDIDAVRNAILEPVILRLGYTP